MTPTNLDTSKIKENINDLILDQLSVGLDPNKVVFCQQSKIPQDQELAIILAMLASKSRLERIPTLKEMLRDLKIENPSLGLLSYPVMQAADILMVKADLVPVGKDQASHLELTKELAEKFNSTYKKVFNLPESLIPKDLGTLPGIDGKAKMSKSLNNAIYLSDDEQTVREKVMKMYTDPTRIRPTDPGHIEGNPTFLYHDAFNSNRNEVDDLKQRYVKGEVSDVEVKEKLAKAINSFLDPIRKKRAAYEKQTRFVDEILESGTKRTREEAQKTLEEVFSAMDLS